MKDSTHSKHGTLGSMFEEHGFSEFKWIRPENIVIGQWVRIKCMFGCGDYGQNASCPPNVPSIAECERFFQEYKEAVIFRFEKRFENPDDRHAWSKQINTELMALERKVFLAGYYKAFLLLIDGCSLCADCPGERHNCKQPKLSRPTPEAMGIDVYATVRNAGYFIQVCADYSQIVNRYAFLLIE